MSVVSSPSADFILRSQGYRPEDAYEDFNLAVNVGNQLVRSGDAVDYKIVNEGKGVRLRYTLYIKNGASVPGFLKQIGR